MDCGKSLLIWGIDPRLDFDLESSFIHFISMSDFAVGLEMLEIYFELDEIVLEGSEVQQSGSIFISHDG
jgi:hypothetical protein